eukprot:TRINITY_DN5623_c0_g1_i1.p1 TRINITY_DN5623_c0_g1~~TRINITY_DN5623_c0_g1_i1.p1  ORF type:complete len:526 (+),score=140.78 TRINITY_DN5623_c0_g1_i1:168-1745(+)
MTGMLYQLGEPEFHSEQARKDGWNKLLAGSDLKFAKQAAMNGQLRRYPIRSLCWKAFLGCVTGDVATWGKQLSAARKRYDELIAMYMVDPHQAETDPSFDNPLSQDENSSWNQFFQNIELQKEINQDIERTYPENEFFQRKTVHSIMLRILFIYAKITPELVYRQGMHELLAPIVYLLEHEKVSTKAEDDPTYDLMNAEYVEHDSFLLFTKLMHITGKWFGLRTNDTLSDDSRNSPVLKKCSYIQQVLLKEKDPQLYTYLEDLKVEPQLYALRWIRLLVGREFELNDLLNIWDALFAFGEDLYLLDYMCVAMLMFIRTQLLSMDQSNCLRRLMKYPSVDEVQSFVEKALQLSGRQEYLPPPSPQAAASAAPQSPAAAPRKPKAAVDPLVALLESVPDTFDELKIEVVRHRKTQYHLSKRLERITFIFQNQLLSISNQSPEDLEAVLLALAELKQIKDILAGLLPDEEEGVAIVNPMKPATMAPITQSPGPSRRSPYSSASTTATTTTTTSSSSTPPIPPAEGSIN